MTFPSRSSWRLALVSLAAAIGWLPASLPIMALAADPFTVVLLPDTQKYTLQSPINNPYSVQTSWIANNKEAENIQFMIHLGDMVENNNLYPSQWAIADAAHTILDNADVPYSVMPGNHDMTGSGPPNYTRDSTLYNQYFGRDRFDDQPWYGDSFGAANNSSYSLFTAGGMDFIVLSLELMARDATLDWANDVLDAHPNHRAIVATHKYLTVNGTRDTDTVYGNYTGNNADQVFDKLIKDHDNVFMVVCGHAHGEALHVASNAAGNPVHEILSDYQSLPSGGDGWLRTLEFRPDDNQIVVGSYSPVLDQSNLFGQYTLTYDMGGTTPVPSPSPVRPAAHWTLDDGQTSPLGRTAADALPNEIDGALVNYGSTAPWSSGQVGGALSFDGTNDRVDMGAAEPLDLTGDLSMSFWVKPAGTGAANYGLLVGKNQSGGSADDAYFVDIAYAKSVTGAAAAAGTLEFVITDGDSPVVLRGTSPLSLTDAAWRHVAVTFSAGTRMALYIDGELSAELTAGVPESCDSTAFPFSLGNLGVGSSTDAYCFKGFLDDVWVFDGALTAAQVARLAEGVSPFLPGDANGDDQVDDADAATLAANWLQPVQWGTSDGDFNNDGRVDDRDAAILAAHWIRGDSGETVPEPALLVHLLAAAAVWTARRRFLSQTSCRG